MHPPPVLPQSPPVARAGGGAEPRVLLVFVDALGPQQLAAAGGLGGLPYRGQLQGILGYSCGALPTILTGTAPEQHGRMCLFAHAHQGEGVLSPLVHLGLLPRLFHERGRVRRLVARALARSAGLTGYVDLYRVPPELFSWLDLPEREDLFTSERIGGQETFLAEARRAGMRVFTAPWRMPEAERWVLTEEVLRTKRPQLAFAYATELDGTLHRTGNGSPEVAAAGRRVTTRIERAVEAMRAGGGDVTTIIVGDHGMADIERIIDPRPLVKHLGGMRLFVDSTMMRFWGEDRELDRARALLEAEGVPGRWLDTRELEARRAPVKDAPYGRAMLVLDEGHLFSPSFVGGTVRGMHGYDVNSPSARAAIASDRPIPSSVGALTDVAGWIRSLLGLGQAGVSWAV